MQVVRLMKQKEEKLLQAQRTRTLISVEGQHLLRYEIQNLILNCNKNNIFDLEVPVFFTKICQTLAYRYFTYQSDPVQCAMKKSPPMNFVKTLKNF